MNFEQTPATPEKESRSLPSFDRIAADLLADEVIKQLPDGIDQGRVIADRFVGALVRHGEVAGSQKSYSPQEVLQNMDLISREGDAAVRTITGTDGLRRAVVALASDERVGREFGRFEGRVSVDEAGKYTLTSPAQLEGYLLSGGDKNRIDAPVGGVHMYGDSWIPVITEHVSRMAENPHMDAMTYRTARELMTSSAPLIQNTGRDMEMALHSAERAGVDIDLLKRSSEKIQQRTVTDREMGATALFIATEGTIAGYKQSLDRRSL